MNDQKPSSPKGASLAPPSSNEKRPSINLKDASNVRRLSDTKTADTHSDKSSDQSERARVMADPELSFALATTATKLPISPSSESLREVDKPRRRSVEFITKGRIGGYEYEKAVQGLMGKYTYFGYKSDTNVKVTLKIIDKKNPIVEPLRIEYTMLRNMSHPNLLQVYDILDDDQNVYFIMEYASRGRLLYEVGSNGPLSERDARTYMQQIVAAVIYNYEIRHAVFREMELDYFTYFRAENVFLDHEGNIKIGAYGSIDLRKPSRTWFKQHSFPSFAAPEILKGKTFLLGIDAWTLGVLLYVLTKASFPFTGETVDDVLKCVNTHVRLDVGSEEMRNLCSSLLQPNTFARLPIFEISKHAWWQSPLSAGAELQRQLSRKEDDRGKKGKSIFGISFGKDKKTSDSK